MSRIARFFSIAFLAAGVLAPTVASADEAWQTSFDPTTLAAYHDKQVTGIIVLSGGDPGRDMSQAAAALRAAYVKAKITDLVMDDESLGSVSGLSDEQIVKKARHLPVSHVAIVRVYGKKNAITAVITVYDKWGATYTSFAVKKGVPLAAPGKSVPPPAGDGTGDPPDGGSTDGAPPTGPDGGSAETDGNAEGGLPIEEVIAVYDSKVIIFDSAIYKEGKLLEWEGNSRAFQGDAKTVLEGAEFYVATGHKDLATKYRKRSLTRWSFILGGIAIAVGGVSYPVLLGEDCAEFGMMTSDRQDCEDRSTRRTIIGAVVTGAGLITWLVGWVGINPHPVSAAEAQTLVDEHNAKLREQLDVPVNEGEPLARARRSRAERSNAANAADQRSTRPAIELAPFASPGGGGLVLLGRF